MKAGPKRCFTIDNRAAINLIGTQARPDEIHIELIHRLLQHLHIDTTNKLTAKDGLYFVRRKLICRLTKEWRSITRYQASNRVRLRVSLPLNQRWSQLGQMIATTLTRTWLAVPRTKLREGVSTFRCLAGSLNDLMSASKGSRHRCYRPRMPLIIEL